MANVKTIAASGADYTTVSSWESYADGIIDDDDQTGQITGLTDDNSLVYFNGIDDSTNTIRLEAASGQEADGSDAAGAQIDVGLSFYEATNQATFEVHGIEFHTTSSVAVTASMDNADSMLTITKCVFRDLGSTAIFIAYCAAITVRVGCCLFRDNATATTYKYSVGINEAAVTDVTVLHCTTYNCWASLGELSGTFAKAQNNAACCYDVNNSFDDYYSSPSNMSNCFSSGDGTGNTDTLRDDDTDFTDTSTDDFTLVSDGVLTGAGSAVSSESWFPSTDLAGNSWASPPSVGCFEYVSGGGGTTHQGAASDGVSMGATSSAVLTIQGAAVDGSDIGDQAAGNLAIGLAAVDGIDLGDTASGSITATVTVTDGAALGDSAESQATFQGACVDGLTLSDVATAIMTIKAALADGVVLGDSSGPGSIYSEVASDGFAVGDTAGGLLSALAAAIDGLVLGDTPEVVCTFEVEAADGMTLGDTATAVASLLETLVDGFVISDSSGGTTELATGRVTVSFSGNKAIITFNGSKPTISSSGSKPGITFEGE